MSIEDGHIECALLRGMADDMTARQSIYENGNRITCVDRAIIERYFEGRVSPVSLTRSERPAKWRRRWIAGGRLPATLRTGMLPRELETKLSALDAGYERLVVDGDVLCVEVDSLKIVDVMHNAGAPPMQDTATLLVDPGLRASNDRRNAMS